MEFTEVKGGKKEQIAALIATVADVQIWNCWNNQNGTNVRYLQSNAVNRIYFSHYQNKAYLNSQEKHYKF